MFSSEFKILFFLGFLKLKIKKKKLNFEVTSNIKYVFKTGNPKENAGKDRMTFSLIIKAKKKNLTWLKRTVSSLMGLTFCRF